MATQAHSTRTPLLRSGSGRQPGPVTLAIRTMRKAERIDDAVQALAALRQRDPAIDNVPRLCALRSALADRIEADIALLDALAPDADFEPSLGSLGGMASVERMPQTMWAIGGTEDREDGDDNGIADDGGRQEQSGLRDELVAL
ncbi:hypothetical protein [Methylobacterium sp. Leaf118]|uniref:hypothetical protein n=1 Tax=Methylobacterium sp. Leaf118 TaxID=2876562 RepID=UPI001E4CFCE3|nr:hypothetical protein [Methylobacterium sp. Leaf118]